MDAGGRREVVTGRGGGETVDVGGDDLVVVLRAGREVRHRERVGEIVRREFGVIRERSVDGSPLETGVRGFVGGPGDGSRSVGDGGRGDEIDERMCGVARGGETVILVGAVDRSSVFADSGGEVEVVVLH